MAKIELGRVGAVVSPGAELDDTAARLDALGYQTVWVTGGPLESLDQVPSALRAMTSARIATGIIPVVRFPSDDVVALYRQLEAEAPGRFVVGLGGAHGPKPFATLNAYLDRLDEAGVPASRRVLAALGPKMLDLARERASGAFPVFYTPDAVAGARARLDDDTTLAVEVVVTVSSDPAAARELGRSRLSFLSQMPAYQASFRRQEFTDDDISSLSDRLVDGLAPWGDADTVAGRVDEFLAAGADHVAVSVTAADTAAALAGWSALAERLVA
jgi:probable F420-dependent oxidoreductase